MNICFITHNLPFGTYEAFVIPEIKYLISAGHSITIIPLRPEGKIVHSDSEALLKYSVKLPLCNGRILAGAIRAVFRNPLAVAKIFKKIGKSRSLLILIKNFAVVPKALWLTEYLRQVGIPDHIHVHWLNASATMALITASILKIPWSVTAHRKDIAINNLIKEKVESCAFIRCINENGAKEIRSFAGETEKIHVIHMGVEIAAASKNQQIIKKNENHKFRILMPANFVEVKGHKYLLQAIQLLCLQGEAVQVDLAGEGKLKKSMQIQVNKLGLKDCVDFLGEVSHAILLEKLATGCYDCVALPSIVTKNRDKEGIPVALMEAMAAGVPVISTKTGGIPELCVEGTALLVPEKDPSALAKALLVLLHDAKTRNSMIALGKKRVTEYFNIETTGLELSTMMQNKF